MSVTMHLAFLTWVPFAVSLFVAIVFRRRQLVARLKCILASIIQYILIRALPIHSVEEKSRPLPSTPFWGPGGSGDEAKFMNGPQNSLAWGRLYGPIYRIWSGWHTEVVVTTAEDIKAIFHDSDRHFKAKNSDAGWMMGEVLGQCVGLLSGTEWISLRTRVEVPFLHKNVIEFLPTILTGTRRYFSDLLERQNHEKGDGQKKPITIHAAEDMKFLPFALVASLIYDEALSKDLEKKLYELVPTRERLFRHVIAGGITRFWWSSLLPTEANRLLGQFQRAWIAFNGQAYENAQRMGLDVPIVSLWEQAQSGETDQTQLLQSLDEVLFANLDVTTGALSWLLVNIANNPSIQSRLHDEVVSQLGVADSRDDSALLAYINASGTYLAACVAESARVRPVAAFSIPQAPPTDRVVAGYRIPGRTSVVVDAYALNIRNPFWGADGAVFRPERWSEIKASEARYQMWRFGFGPRMCMGRHIAEKMLRVALVLLIQEWEMQIEGGGGEFETNPESWITCPDVGIELHAR